MIDEAGWQAGGRAFGGEGQSGLGRRASGLGWLSLGLGLSELLTPSAVARFIGVEAGPFTRLTLRALGLRELVAGLGILAQPRPAGWVWARVAGDAMDLALLGAALFRPSSNRLRLTAAAGLVAGVTLLDALTGRQLSRHSPRSITRPLGGLPVQAAAAITVNVPVERAYRFWRSIDNLPRFLSQLESVQVLDETRSRWRMRVPGARAVARTIDATLGEGLGQAPPHTVEWIARVVEDRANQLIAWRTEEDEGEARAGGRGVLPRHSGSVRFHPAPGHRGTEVRVEVTYRPPGGAMGALVATLLGESPGQRLARDLRRYKQLLETGEILMSDATRSCGLHSARPDARG